MSLHIETRQNTQGTAPVSCAETDCCTHSTDGHRLQVENAAILALRFKALADTNRLRILSIISASEEAETCVCDFPEPLGLTQPTVSHHLKILVEAGLLHREKRGVWAYYSLVPGALEALAKTLTTEL